MPKGIPTYTSKWYRAVMAAHSTHPMALGDRGRLVVPIDVRERHGWHTGTPLVSIDMDEGLLVMSAEEGLNWLRQRYAGRDLIGELLADRHAEVDVENA